MEIPLIRDVGEQGLLQLFRPFCSDLVGDDAAVMGALPEDRELVVTTDMLVDGVHFSNATTSAGDVGWRAAAVNLSDLAAMGAQPWGVTIAVGLPPTTSVDWIKSVYQGFHDCLQQYGVQLVGGDTVRSPHTCISVTAFGTVMRGRVIQRHAAQDGDLILITGNHGLSKAGLELLLHPELADRLSDSSFREEIISSLVRSHQRPTPRLDVPPLIWSILQEQALSPPIRLAGMDSSDGLADAVLQICRASGVGARLDWQEIPIPEVIEPLAGDRALDWVLYGGEDFELVLCLPPRVAKALVARLPEAAIIGEIISGDRVEGLAWQSTFQHFQSQ
nr:thiamine-phosphate kinase [Pseudanabaena sp. PCC 6802]